MTKFEIFELLKDVPDNAEIAFQAIPRAKNNILHLELKGVQYDDELCMNTEPKNAKKCTFEMYITSDYLGKL